MERNSFYSCLEGSTRKSREAIQIDWYLNHFKQEYAHPVYSWSQLNKLKYRQAKKLSKKYGWEWDESI